MTRCNMKITAKQFALSLYEIAAGRPAGQVKVAIKKFIGLLAEKNMLAQADKIIAEFIKIWNENHGIVEADVASAKSLDKDTLKLLKKYIAELSGAKEVTVSESVDKNILGGVVIKYEDKVLDGSLKTSLEELKNNLIK
ncbi:MAG: ATP synthase F1 subunit delta [bacterium]|nr:ATP synthase F1 subunit delta [bacterium]